MRSKKSLKEAFPLLALEWHPDLNEGRNPEEFAPKSNKKVWWQCSEGHIWEAVIASRSAGAGCKLCKGLSLVKGTNDLKTKYPKLAKEWDYEKNRPLRPEDVMPGSNKPVWWVCKLGHSYESKVSKRTGNNSGCKYCSGKALGKGINDLATTHPKLALQWHPTANGDLTPSDVQKGSGKKVYWICEKGHTYYSSISNRTAKKSTNCSICSGQGIGPGHNDLKTLRPDIAAQWHPTLNGKLKPTDVTVFSSEPVMWQCLLDQRHYWKAPVYSRTAGSGCGVCKGRVVISGVNDFTSTHPNLLEDWDYENNSLDPNMLFYASSKPVWWKCRNSHSWCTPLKSRTVRGFGCRICGGQAVQPGENDLATTHPGLLAEWDFDKNFDLSPDRIIAGTNKKIDWKCKLGHKWSATGNHRVAGQRCPYCATGGFEISKPGIFYYIEHPEVGASKIGITNTHAKTKRLEAFRKLGWVVVTTIQYSDGATINSLETRMLNWIRKDLGVPPFLTKGDMGKIAGWSETFPTLAVDRGEILSRIHEERELLSIP